MKGRSTLDDWLAAEVERAREKCDRFVIIESLPYFAQLMPNHRTLYGEVISNRYLDGAHQLTSSQEKRLLDLGWSAPGTPCHPDCHAPLHPNFTMTWPSTTPSKQVARDLLRGLLITLAGVSEGAEEITIKSSPRTTKPSFSVVPRH